MRLSDRAFLVVCATPLICLLIITGIGAQKAWGGSSRPATPVVEHGVDGREAFYGTVTLQKLAKTFDYDPPSLDPGYQAWSPNLSMPDVLLGDPCFVGVTSALVTDGGSGYADLVDIRAIAIKNGFIQLRFVNIAGGDGGSVNQPDAGVNVQCITATKLRN